MAPVRNFAIAIAATFIAILPGALSARTEASDLTIAQLAAVEQISAYLSDMSTLSGNFIQTAADGNITEGRFFIEKPGRLRFDYDEPTQIQVISDGLWIAVQNRKLKTTEKYPLVTTPLKMILSDDVNLMRDAKILAVYPETELVTVSIEETAGEAPGTLTLMFDPIENKLTRWTVTDVQGLDTTVVLENVVAGEPIDPKMFNIIEHRILDVGGSGTR